jgi:hypothetical protein
MVGLDRTALTPADSANTAAGMDNMEISQNIHCPFCGQSFPLAIDTTESSQRFTTDCEICCRPFEIVAECQPGEILSLDVLGN